MADNKAVIAEMVRLRAERARLLGFADFAHYRLDDAMAKTPAAVRGLLDTVWARARQKALAHPDAMQELVRQAGRNLPLPPPHPPPHPPHLPHPAPHSH